MWYHCARQKNKRRKVSAIFVSCVKQVPTAAISVDNNDSSIVINRMFRNKNSTIHRHMRRSSVRREESFAFRGVILPIQVF